MIVKVLSFALLVTACYLGWWAAEYAQPIWYLAALLLASCGTGLLLGRTWASYLWYAIGLGVAAVWLLRIFELALNGWPVTGNLETVISLLPGAVLLIACIGGSFAVRRAPKQQRRH